MIRGGYGLSYNGEQIAISANIVGNPGLAVSPVFSYSNPTTWFAQPLPNCGIIYALSSDPAQLERLSGEPERDYHVWLEWTPNKRIVVPKHLPQQPADHAGPSLLGRTSQYDLGHDFVASLGYQGSISRDIFFHENPLAVPATLGYTFNPQIGGGDYWGVNGRGNYNAMLAELKHRFSQQFMADTQYTWSKCMDTSSAPYSEQPYPYNLGLDYGRCDYNVQNAFKVFAVWQPVFFHGSNSWLEKVAGGWSLSGIFTVHSGFPWTPMTNVSGGNTYCPQCGYGSLFPAAYLGGAGNLVTNGAFETVANSNFPKGGTSVFFTGLPTPPSSEPRFLQFPASLAIRSTSLDIRTWTCHSPKRSDCPTCRSSARTPRLSSESIPTTCSIM